MKKALTPSCEFDSSRPYTVALKVDVPHRSYSALAGCVACLSLKTSLNSSGKMGSLPTLGRSRGGPCGHTQICKAGVNPLASDSCKRWRGELDEKSLDP
jgi:hypothetical protein